MSPKVWEITFSPEGKRERECRGAAAVTLSLLLITLARMQEEEEMKRLVKMKSFRRTFVTNSDCG